MKCKDYVCVCAGLGSSPWSLLFLLLNGLLQMGIFQGK
jgi:hypothetical protein